ncbi:hypothetical protein D3C79_948350 [compost metagenome]
MPFFCTQVIQGGGKHQADDPGNIHITQGRHQRTGIELSGDERQLHQHTEHIDADTEEVPTTVATIRIGQSRYVIALAGDAVVVHQIDRAPGGKER